MIPAQLLERQRSNLFLRQFCKFTKVVKHKPDYTNMYAGFIDKIKTINSIQYQMCRNYTQNVTQKQFSAKLA